MESEESEESEKQLIDNEFEELALKDLDGDCDGDIMKMKDVAIDRMNAEEQKIQIKQDNKSNPKLLKRKIYSKYMELIFYD